MTDRPLAIVTGAGSGVGRDTVILLAEAGYNVVLVARTESALAATVDLARRDGGAAAELVVCPADVSTPEAAPRIVETALARFGRIDALANVAGIAPLMPIDRITPESWRACVDTNLGSVVLLTAAVWPTFRKQRRGVVVNVSSMASIDPFPGFAMYAAAKIGVNLFTRCTAEEGKRLGVRAVCIAPGAIETPMLRQNFSDKVIPPEKCLDPMDIAAVIRDCVTGRRDLRPAKR